MHSRTLKFSLVADFRRRAMAALHANSANIVVMRHAETVWNAPRVRVQGQLPSPEIYLSNEGRASVVPTLAEVAKPDVLICSPLLRCRQTAETWFGVSYNDIPIPKDTHAGLREINAGSYEGRYVDELKSDPLWNVWMKNPQAFPGFPGGETLFDFQARVLSALSDICVTHGNSSNTTYVISHGIAMRVLKCFLAGQDVSQLWSHQVVNLERMALTPDQIIKLQQISGNTAEQRYKPC